MCYNSFMSSINNFLLEKQLSTISTTVPDRLDYLMRLNNLTNIALSEIMCCAESTISGYRTGRRVPDIFVICHLSTIFGVTPNYFLGFTDEICPTHNWLCDIYIQGLPVSLHNHHRLLMQMSHKIYWKMKGGNVTV